MLSNACWSLRARIIANLTVAVCIASAQLPDIVDFEPAYDIPGGSRAAEGYPFTELWMAKLATGAPGCHNARTGHFDWRISGLGCNMVRECKDAEFSIFLLT